MSTLRDSLIGIFGRGYALAMGFVSMIIIARGLRPAAQGEFFLMMTTAYLMSAFADLGLSFSAVVFSAGQKHSIRTVARSLLCLAVLSSLVLTVIWTIVSRYELWQLMTLPSDLLLPALILTPALTYANYWAFMLVGKGRIALINQIQGLTATVFLAGVVLLFTLGNFRLHTVVLLQLTVSLLQFLVQILVAESLGRSEPAPPGKNIPGLAAAMLRFGLPGYPGSLATMFFLRVGILVLSRFHGSEATGVYSVAYQLADRLQLAVKSIQDAIYGKVIAGKGAEGVENLNRYLRVSFFLLAVLVLGGIVLASPVIRILYGASYLGAILPLRILLAGSGVLGMSVLISTYFVGQIQKPGLLSLTAIVHAVVATLAGLALTPTFGINGAATAHLATMLFVFLVSVGLYVRFSGSRLRDVLFVRAGDSALLQHYSALLYSSIRGRRSPP